VPGVNFYLVGKDKKSVTDAGEKLMIIATWEVGTADATPEEHIAANQELLFPAIKADMSG
jgi:hypothetical protein